MRSVTIGSAILQEGDALELLRALAPGSMGGLLGDPPYSSGGAFRSDRAQPTSAKYQSSSDRGKYPEFQGDTRDQRSYLAWSTLWLAAARRAVKTGGIGGVFTDWRQLPITTDAFQAAGWVWRGIVVWDKTAAGRPQLGRYRNQAEYVVWGTNGARALKGPIVDGVFRHRVPMKKHHIAGKPVGLMSDLLAIIDGPVLDPFMGSAPIGLACLEAGLGYVGMEAEPAYFDIAFERMREAAAQ
ncbi:DNA methyltransferase [Methylopila sp. M107]|uniref:DNA-methyltransferase n=1 Tax=Methylopila sp. M107 TaxID=1101190 RepID=UPI00037E1025|nr:DNA methyltransferase [Methylopila sp. M107]